MTAAGDGVPNGDVPNDDVPNDDVKVETHGRTLVITIDRPEQRNTMTLASTAIAEALDHLDGSPRAHRRGDHGRQWNLLLGDGPQALHGRRSGVASRAGPAASPKRRRPSRSFAAVEEGTRFTGGFEMVLAADLTVAAVGAKFGLPEVESGLVAGAGGCFVFRCGSPHAIALELILTGELLGAPRAAELGLINRLVPDGEALDEALRLAAAIEAERALGRGGVEASGDRIRELDTRRVVRAPRRHHRPGFRRQREVTLTFAEKTRARVEKLLADATQRVVGSRRAKGSGGRAGIAH